MLRLEKVTGKNVWELLKLQVSEDQKTFVADNDVSMIEAYTTISGNGYAFPFGIYDGDTPVGFLRSGMIPMITGTTPRQLRRAIITSGG